MQRMSVRYGPALVHLASGRPLRHLTESVFVPINGQAVMGAGLAGEVRLAAGPEVEQELRLRVPLAVGSAYLTGSGMLSGHGVERLIYGVVVAQPGGAPRRGDPDRSLEAGLGLLESTTLRSMTMPQLNRQAPERSANTNAGNVARILAAHLRRGSRLREIVIAGLDSNYLQACRAALIDLGGTPE